MRTTTVSSKGQVTLPAEELRELGIPSGEKLIVVRLHDGFLLLRKPESLARRLRGSAPDGWDDPERLIDADRSEWR